MAHETCGFAEIEYAPQPATEVHVEDDGVRVSSQCPQCDWRSESVFPKIVGGATGSRTDALSPPVKGVVAGACVVCACGFPHAQRPADAGESGCGAYWTLSGG